MSPLSRCNPSAVLIGLFVVSAALMFVFDPLVAAGVHVAALAVCAVGARLTLRELGRAQLAFLGFAVGILLVNAVSRPGELLVSAGPLRVTEEGLAVGAALAFRTLTLGTLSVAFLRAVDPVALMTSLHLDLRLPARVTFAILAGQRMLQQLPAEWATIRAAHAVRAPLDRRGRPRRGSFPAAAFGLLVSCIRRSARVSQSLEARGLGLEPRTTWRR
ncbi:energy-coupling factor transport system permease protein [Diaminobutyricimonas aerilata]|uniref:Energy-coupling factor transport system permease protein n=1 Tax=Diaminobutyricimonas aerilata TaxID=1162967 RepID=A0A2M9CKU3_9MICO|nr:energy-coupling factor transporter transmembrane component T [Diaminobutyricimonas aerilata]PJJ72523.1 energy-coupling factor transport system permease protein [Diaminobutyricimonas aerilata]